MERTVLAEAAIGSPVGKKQLPVCTFPWRTLDLAGVRISPRSSLLGGIGMAGGNNRRVYECVIVDLNTQHDFCDPAGANPVANVGELIPALRQVVAWAKRNGAPVVSSIESHRGRDLPDSAFPICCIDGTPGQRKLDFTLLRHSTYVQADNTLCCAVDLFRRYQQIIFKKRTDDLLSNPKADRLLTQVSTDEFIICGTTIEGSVKVLALALLARELPVTVVTDACGYWNKALAELSLRQVVAKGARTITISELLARKLARRRRFPLNVDRSASDDNGDTRNGNGRIRSSNPLQPSSKRLPNTDERTRIPKEKRGVGESGV